MSNRLVVIKNNMWKTLYLFLGIAAVVLGHTNDERCSSLYKGLRFRTENYYTSTARVQRGQFSGFQYIAQPQGCYPTGVSVSACDRDVVPEITIEFDQQRPYYTVTREYSGASTSMIITTYVYCR